MDIAICTGKSCRRRAECGVIRDALAGCAITDTSCLGICKGPVVVLDPRGAEPRVVARVRSAKTIRDVRRVAVRGREASGRVRDRTVGGTKRTKAVERARRGAHRTGH